MDSAKRLRRELDQIQREREDARERRHQLLSEVSVFAGTTYEKYFLSHDAAEALEMGTR